MLLPDERSQVQRCASPHPLRPGPCELWQKKFANDSQLEALMISTAMDVVFGKGTMVIEDVAQNVTAAGTVSGDKMSPDVLTSDISLFRLKLTMSGKSIFTRRLLREPLDA